MKVLLIDNRDSFTFNLVEACRVAGALVEVTRNSIPAETAVARALQCGALLMLSPGPGKPSGAGCSLDLITLAAGRVPLIGICLGHQAIVEAVGGTVVRAHEASHGKSSAIVHDGRGPFAGLPSPMRVGRYHSLCTPLNTIPERLRVHAVLDGMAMAVSDDEAGHFGLQFHPESILTPLGNRLFGALLDWAEKRRLRFAGLTAAAPRPKIAA
ncbi:MAG: aminodeoxychorismate/anthranilate synthase component II [Pseudomonadota bacterium]|nr:aminodeoxychorismate/anthranilate synthase component II [Pseudomonadota bacterium]